MTSTPKIILTTFLDFSNSYVSLPSKLQPFFLKDVMPRLRKARSLGPGMSSKTALALLNFLVWIEFSNLYSLFFSFVFKTVRAFFFFCLYVIWLVYLSPIWRHFSFSLLYLLTFQRLVLVFLFFL